MTIKQTLLLLALTGFALTACQPKQATPQATDLSTVDTPDSNEISLDDAKKYVKQYAPHAGTVDSLGPDRKILKLENTRAIWLDTVRMVKLLAKLRKEKGNGIRIYLATYDSPPKTANGVNSTFDPKYVGYNTIVMVSTKDSINKKGRHFNRDYYTEKGAAANSAGAGFIVGTPPTNRGEMCPPPRDCPSIGATLIE